MAVMVVTDSSARLDPDDLQQWGIRQVPLHVLVDGQDTRDGLDQVPYDVHDRAHATTAGAAPTDLAEAYRKALAESGGDGVVAVHLSAALSSTFSTAVAAAREFGAAVRVVNARSAAAGVGFVAVAARVVGRWRRPGCRRGRGQGRRAAGASFIVVHRLDNLRRSGRIGTAASWLGTALSLKPLLCLDVDGGWCSPSGSGRCRRRTPRWSRPLRSSLASTGRRSSCITSTTTTTPTRSVRR
jgi:DegV family protein with EDD domain